MKDKLVKTSYDWVSVPWNADKRDIVEHAARTIARDKYGGVPKNIRKKPRGTYLFDIQTDRNYFEGAEKVYANRVVVYEGFPKLLYSPVTVLLSTFYSGIQKHKRNPPRGILLCEQGNRALYWQPHSKFFMVIKYFHNNLFSLECVVESWRWVEYYFQKHFKLPTWKEVDHRIMTGLGERFRINRWGVPLGKI